MDRRPDRAPPGRARPATAALAALAALAACADGGGAADASAADAAPADAAFAGFPQPCADVYDPDTIERFDVTIDDAAWQGLLADRADRQQRYHPVVFQYGEEPPITDAMIRLKGNPEALLIWDKMQFVISFNEVDADARFHGLRKLNLDHAPYDPSLLRPRIGFDYFADLGFPASCANTAVLTMNGAIYGVFNNIEVVNKDFLDRNFEDDDGDLYKYGFQKETNEEEPDRGEMAAFWAATSIEELAAQADLEQLVAFWAAEAALPFGDGWWGHGNNFFLYDTADRGFVALPWDPDFALEVVGTIEADPLTYDFPWDGDVVTPRPRPWAIVMEDPAWCDRFLAELERALAAYDADGRSAQVTAWAAQIAPFVADDPRVDWQQHVDRIAALEDYFPAHAAYLADWLAVHRALPLDGDGDGISMCRDCDDTDAAVGACPPPP